MTKFKILVVDDEEEFLVKLVERLELRGLDVKGALTGEEALDSLEDRPVDVVVLDVRLPGMDGVQVLNRVKKRHPYTEVVVLTGYASAETAVRVMELGAFDYLVKPVRFEDLLYRLEDAYKKKTLRETTEERGRKT